MKYFYLFLVLLFSLTSIAQTDPPNGEFCCRDVFNACIIAGLPAVYCDREYECCLANSSSIGHEVFDVIILASAPSRVITYTTVGAPIKAEFFFKSNYADGLFANSYGTSEVISGGISNECFYNKDTPSFDGNQVDLSRSIIIIGESGEDGWKCKTIAFRPNSIDVTYKKNFAGLLMFGRIIITTKN